MADVVRIRADNPSPLTLDGTNTWVAGRGPCFVVDPGPDLPGHLEAVVAEVSARGGASHIALTHDHGDHSGGLQALRDALGGPPVVAQRWPGAVDATGAPFEAVPTPGHAPDHLVFVFEDVAFTGDAVLGAGSVFLQPGRGSLSGYLAALRALRSRGLARLLPGHGPPVDDPAAKLDEYVAHRLERERRLIDALAAGARSVEALLDAAWSDVPEHLRFAAAITLAAHLDKLEEEGRLPGGVERPELPDFSRASP